MRQTKRWLALLLVAVMLLTAAPVSAMAASEDPDIVTSSSTLIRSALPNDSSRSTGTLRLGFASESLRSAYPVEDIMTALNIDKTGGKTIVAYGTEEGDYTAVEGGVINFSALLGSYSSRSVYFVVAAKIDQLSTDNEFYYATVSNDVPYDLFDVENAVNVTKSDTDITAKIYSSNFSSSTDSGQLYLRADAANYASGDSVKLKLKLDSKYSTYTPAVYEGPFTSKADAEAAEAANLTDEFFNTGHTGIFGSWPGNSQSRNKWYTLVLTDTADDIVYQQPFMIYIGEARPSLYPEISKTANREYLSCYPESTTNESYEYKLYKEMEGTVSEYYVRLRYRAADYTYETNPLTVIEKAVIGRVETAEQIIAQPNDVKNQLFFDNMTSGGYSVALDETLTVSALDTYGNVLHVSVRLSQGDRSNVSGPSDDTGFTVTGAEDATTAYRMRWEDDSSYQDGYQAVLLLNSYSGAIANGAIKPIFTTSGGATVYAGQDGSAGEKQTSGESTIDFTAPVTVVPYSVESQSQAVLTGTRWVSFVTQASGAKLFVNGATGAPEANLDEETSNPVRTVKLDDAHGNHHDIFFANIGNTPLTGLSATLSASGLKLDEYWKIGQTDTLPMFSYTSYGAQNNMGKLRLVPDNENEDSFGTVDGTLIITSNGGTETIRLTGTVGQPKIITDSVPDAVRFVPYSCVIQTNYTGDNVADALTFSIAGGNLPTEFELKPNGEIYGVPKTATTYNFTVKVTGKGDFAGYTATADYTLEVKNNTAANVEATTDSGYEFVNDERVPNMTAYSDQIFHSNGNINEFLAIYLDGNALAEDTDYTKVAGSTKITIAAQTFSRAGNGEHTLSAEFRTNSGNENTGDLKVTSQNYTSSVSSGATSGGTTSDDTIYIDNTSGGGNTASSGTAPGTDTNTPVEIQYEVSDGTATMQDLTESEVAQLSEQAADGRITLDFSDSGKATDTAVLPRETLHKLADVVSDEGSSVDAIVVRLTSAEVEFDSIALEAISDQASGGTVSLTVEEIPVDELSEVQQAALADTTVEKVVSAALTSNEAELTDFDGGRMTMRVPFTMPSNRNPRDYAVYYVAPEGQKVLHSAEVVNGFIAFRTAHLSDYVIVYEPLENVFSDVADNSWYTSFVDYVSRAKLMQGVSSSEFASDTSLTRAMFAQILYNAEKAENGAPAAFEDVADGTWYADAVNWMAMTGIANGISATQFAPDSEITREQLVTFFYNYAVYKGYDVSCISALSLFKDAENVSDWAQSPMNWAVGNKIINGMGDKSLAPTGHATRAQVAKMLAYFFERYSG